MTNDSNNYKMIDERICKNKNDKMKSMGEKSRDTDRKRNCVLVLWSLCVCARLLLPSRAEVEEENRLVLIAMCACLKKKTRKQ